MYQNSVHHDHHVVPIALQHHFAIPGLSLLIDNGVHAAGLGKDWINDSGYGVRTTSCSNNIPPRL